MVPTGLAFGLWIACLPAQEGLTGPTLEISGANCRFPDVAYGSVSRRYLVVWAEYGNTVRIFGRLVNGDGSMVEGIGNCLPNSGPMPNIRRVQFARKSSKLTVGYQQNPLLTLDLSMLRQSLGKLNLDW